MTNYWVCDDCGHRSTDENEPCSCEATCTEHTETIKSLVAERDRWHEAYKIVLEETMRLRPVYQACMRVAELDEECSHASPSPLDDYGNALEMALHEAVERRDLAIDAARKQVTP